MPWGSSVQSAAAVDLAEKFSLALRGAVGGCCTARGAEFLFAAECVAGRLEGGVAAGCAAAGWGGPAAGVAGWGGGSGRRERGLCRLLGRHPKVGLGGSGVGGGAGNPSAGVLAGLAWFTCILRHTKPSSYVTWYGLGTLFTKKGPFPPWCQLIGALRRSRHRKDETSLAIRVSCYRSWRWGHLLVGESEALLYCLHIWGWVLQCRRSACITL